MREDDYFSMMHNKKRYCDTMANGFLKDRNEPKSVAEDINYPLTRKRHLYSEVGKPYQFVKNIPEWFIGREGFESIVTEIKTNIILVIEKNYGRVLAVRKNAKLHQNNNWEIFASETLSGGLEQVNNYLKGKKMSNLVIRTHGTIEDSGIILRSHTITIKSIQSYKAGASRYVNIYDLIVATSYNIKTDGNLIFTACNSGRDIEFLKSLRSILNPKINTFNNQTLSNIMDGDNHTGMGYSTTSYHVDMGSASWDAQNNKGKFWMKGKSTIPYAPMRYTTDVTRGNSELREHPGNSNYTFIEVKDIILQDDIQNPVIIIYKE